MSVAIPIPLLQHLPDVNVSLGAGVDGYALVYDHDTRMFVLRVPFSGTPYALLAGRAGGQTLYGGTGANDDITIHLYARIRADQSGHEGQCIAHGHASRWHGAHRRIGGSNGPADGRVIEPRLGCKGI